jgi:hypothetical protein
MARFKDERTNLKTGTDRDWKAVADQDEWELMSGTATGKALPKDPVVGGINWNTLGGATGPKKNDCGV